MMMMQSWGGRGWGVSADRSDRQGTIPDASSHLDDEEGDRLVVCATDDDGDQKRDPIDDHSLARTHIRCIELTRVHTGDNTRLDEVGVSLSLSARRGLCTTYTIYAPKRLYCLSSLHLRDVRV
jgi:hypothetical protein